VTSWIINVNKIRNLFKTGAAGTVNGRNTQSLATVLEDLVTSLSELYTGGMLPYSDDVSLPSATGLTSTLFRRYLNAPDAASATAVHAAANLAADAQDVASNITNPDIPRIVTVKGNVSGIAGNVVITGTNIAGAAKTDTIALNGTSEVLGVKAFKTVTNINLPARTHTPVAQVETATAVGTITGSGNAAVVVTAAGMTGSPKTLNVAVLENDTAATWAGKVRTALGLDAAVTALFAVSGSGAEIILTKLLPAANDATLNISLDNGTCTGITTAATSADTAAGVPYDTVSVGISKKIGMPAILPYAANLHLHYFDGSNDAGALTIDSDELEKNVYEVAGTPDGSKELDLYFFL
jgi:hypothetical protein